MGDEIVRQPLVESSAPLTLDMPAARQRAIDEAYAMAQQSRSDAHSYQWSCPSVELMSIMLGTQAVPVYKVVVVLSKRWTLFSAGGSRQYTFQLDAVTGRLVGLADSGWQDD